MIYRSKLTALPDGKTAGTFSRDKFMEYLIICIVVLLVAALTFFSGFGLGTLLMPAFALFFPLEVAIATTAIVYLLNNLFKLFLVGRDASKKVVLLFGLPATVFAMGAEPGF